jgi:hypothetical protein
MVPSGANIRRVDPWASAIDFPAMTDLVQIEDVPTRIKGVEDAKIGYPEPVFGASLEAVMRVVLEMPPEFADPRCKLRPDAGGKGAEGLVEAWAVDFRGLFHPGSR